LSSPNNEIIATPLLANETAANTASYTALQATTTTTTRATTANAAPNDSNDANNATRVDTATDVSSTNDVDSQPLSFTYSHEEVQQLLEDVRLEGWQQGFEEGHRTGRKTGHEEGKEDGYEEGYDEGSRKWGEGYREGYEAKGKLNQEKEERVWKEGQLEGHELGTQNGKDEERRKWLTEGHGAGLCLSMAAHARALFHGAVLLEEAKTQTDAVNTVGVDTQITTPILVTADISTQVTPRTDETAVQTNANPERWCAVIQTEPPDDESPTLTKNAETTLRVDSSTQTTAFPAPERPPAPRVRRYTLPSRPTALQPTPQPLPLWPEPPLANATSWPPTSTMATKSVATTPETTIWVTSSTQTDTGTLDTNGAT
jgi:hypothetical protein